MQQSTTQKAPQIERGECRVVNHEEVWEQVLPSLQRLHAMHAEQPWTIAGMRRLLDDGEALLIMGDGDDKAFAIVNVDDYPYKAGELELFVQLVYDPDGVNSIERLHKTFEDMARAAGARYMRFFSQRFGLMRVGPQFGFMPRGVEYVKELDHGR